ncbi:MAG TPA: glycerophosphodiester phosphodiesterase [Candidatus Hydrogenedentes bacterium]|nr:glycerophosphodiester phosphodiesterase [Candidatus Hydrogenedentota bacterium]
MLRYTALLLLLCAMPARAADPIVIAHRGASGYVPEHTLEAYAAAHAMGADYIEPDVVLTKDAVFICLHDIHLESTTDVEEQFPDRKREDGKWYAADFTLAEIKQLRVHERLSNRFPQGKSQFEVPTLAEMIELVQGLNATTGRIAGIYPELKQPSFHTANGLPMEEKFLALLAQYGYTGKDAKIFVQCFEPEPLKRMRLELKSELPQVQLLGSDKEFEMLLSSDGIAAMATYANGIGPAKASIEKTPDIVKWAHKNNLVVHPYTLRADVVPSKYKTFDSELAQFYDTYRVDGVFTDHPDKAVAFVKR